MYTDRLPVSYPIKGWQATGFLSVYPYGKKGCVNQAVQKVLVSRTWNIHTVLYYYCIIIMENTVVYSLDDCIILQYCKV